MIKQHMDSFNNNPDATDQLPTEIGHYWFYGYRYGKSVEFKKELILCKVVETADGTSVIGDRQFIYQTEIEEALFIPATLPELPTETESQRWKRIWDSIGAKKGKG